MENFTMMLGYDPKVTYTCLYPKEQECNTGLFQVAKEDNTNVFQEACVFLYYHKHS